MENSEVNQDTKDFLKNYTPFSVIDRGIEAAEEGFVSECAKSGNQVTGIVKEDDENSYNIKLNIISPSEVDATCTCCSLSDMQEQWCEHAVALLWKSCELGFFTPSSGFTSTESTYRMNINSPEEIADIIKEATETDENINVNKETYTPEVKVILDLESDHLGVQVLFDDEIQESTIFGDYKNNSTRALDNLLIQILDDEGSWDEDNKIWFINSSKSIKTVLGLIQEYEYVVSKQNNQAIKVAKTPINAKVTVEWVDVAAELVMFWALPRKKNIIKTVIKNHDLLGTGPYWVFIEDTIYPISKMAAKIAAIFPHSATITLNRTQVGPVLETLKNIDVKSDLIEVVNPDKEPETQIKAPKPTLEVSLIESDFEHFSKENNIQIKAKLEYIYPEPPKNKKIVILPNREKETEYHEHLLELGFQTTNANRQYLLSNDQALDFIDKFGNLFPNVWTIEGFNKIKKSIKFAKLNLNATINSKSDQEDQKIDWFDCHISLTQNNANIPISTIFKSLKANNKKWIRLDSGAYARIPGGSLEQLKATLGMIAPNYKHANTIKANITSAQAISFHNTQDPYFNISVDRKLSALANKLKTFDKIKIIKPSKNFSGSLRPYQSEGLAWLNFLNDFALDGILADEMGLGKTVQTLALVQKLKESKEAIYKKPVLIVAPTSVTTNWLYEAKRFAPNLKVLLLQGAKRKEDFATIKDYDLVITSYALLRIDRLVLERQEFSYVILDEAQNIKNPLTATAKAAKALSTHRRLALTGTPTENRPMELWSIMDFLMPNYLGSYEFFKNHIEKPIIESGPDVKIARTLNSKTRPFILRRLKSEVEKDLPPKIESEQHVAMTDAQKELYAQILEEVRPKVFEAVESKGVRGASISILSALLRLRQICNHPNSIEAFKEDEDYGSGKFELLKQLVKESLEANRKILVFSQFREMLAIIRRWLDTEDIQHLYLDGATKNRQELVDQFNADENIRLFLISLKAGGTGLNLTAADTVMIYDPWWNPAVESQAVDRAHRIGQTKKVNVYRLVTEDSIEQKIMDLKGKKAKIVDSLINDNGLSGIQLTKQDLESFFAPLKDEN